MNILVIGSGGREHAIAWKIKQSSLCENLFVAPGNGGTAEIATNLQLDSKNHEEIKQAVLENSIEMVVVGPEDPLVNGLVDDLKSDEKTNHVLVIGPSAKGAQLEGSKEFAKDFMNKYGIPTAKAQTFDQSTLKEGYRFFRITGASLCAQSGWSGSRKRSFDYRRSGRSES